MPRAHLYKPITDAQGNVLPGCSVRILDPGTTSLVADTLYVDDSSNLNLLNPFQEINGVINIYLATARRVRVGVTPPGGSEIFFEDVDVVSVGGGVTATSLILTDANSIRWSVTIGLDGGVITTALP